MQTPNHFRFLDEEKVAHRRNPILRILRHTHKKARLVPAQAVPGESAE